MSEDSTHHNTVQLIQAAQAGDRDAEGELWVLLLDEVRRIAHARLRQEKVGITLQTDDLANEAFLKMVNLRDMAFDSRKHFLAMAARAVRQILVDQARARKADKRGGGEGTVFRHPHRGLRGGSNGCAGSSRNPGSTGAAKQGATRHRGTPLFWGVDHGPSGGAFGSATAVM